MADVSVPAAALAGLVSFLSPCVLPLAPPYLCFIAGASIEELASGGESRARRDVMAAAILFVLGFSTVFVGLGATASVFGGLLREYSHPLSILAGLGIIVMGLHFLGLFQIGALYREKRVEIARPPGLWSAYLMGLSFAFGWTPCIGPILATILAVAGSEETAARGAWLLAVYSLGLGAPFLIAAAAMGPFLRFAKNFRGQFGRLEKFVGAALVVTGVAFLSGGLQATSRWLIDAFPALSQLG